MAIQTTKWHPDTCGCEIDYQWDDTTPEATRQHTIVAVNYCGQRSHPAPVIGQVIEGSTFLADHININTTPIISHIVPPSAKAGTAIKILGQRFGPTADTLKFDTFAGTAASWSDGEIDVTIPVAVPVKTVQVVITRAGKNSNLVPFSVTLT